ncbi:AEC family transporter [Marinibaculum pumilum]|uniref:AEC family transporter n=1 Tax=Marinibaculum pumilum TaxID=1766165 RepID=A0ABV7L9W8_9PROT
MQELLNIVLPFFGLIFAGYGFGHTPLLKPEAVRGLVEFVFWFALPAMLFMKIAEAPFREAFDWRFLASYSGAGIIVYGIGFLVALRLFRLALDQSAVFAMGSAFGNVGFMGLPMVALAFGDEALLAAVLAVTADQMIFIPLTSGLIQAGRGDRAALGRTFLNVGRGIVRNPLVIATFCGLAFGLSGLALPVPVSTFGNLLADAAAPCALFALGATLAGRKLGEGKPEVATVSTLKLLVHPAITLGIALLLGLPPFLMGIAVMQAAMPIAANVFIMAQGYEVYVRRSSSAILISTFAAVITLSAVILVLLAE